MTRPSALRDRHYVRRPLDTLLGAPSHIAVLRTLSKATRGLTGREIARLSGVAAQATLDALGRLESAGFVRWLPAGRAHLYELNHGHFLLKSGILPLLEAESEFRPRIRTILKRSLEGHVVSAAIFGSTARGEERSGSDLDLLIIIERREDREKALGETDAVSERLRKEFGIRLSPLAISRSELREGYRKGASFFRAVVKEGETVAGIDLLEVVHG